MARRSGPLRFGADRRGASALEFALCAPLFILLLLVGVDTSRYVFATRQIEDVAATIGQMISMTQGGEIGDKDLQFYRNSAMVIFPQALADAAQQSIPWDQDIDISVASVAFQAASSACTAHCTYVPKVVWAGGTKPRSCTVALTAAPDSAPPSRTTLPASVYGPGSVIVVNVGFAFRPTIAPQFMTTIPIRRSFYVAPRYSASIAYASGGGANGIAHAC